MLIQGSFPGGAIVPAMGQTGTIPADARSIRYYGQAPYTVTFGGQPVPIYAVGSGPNYTIFGGDVSAFANQTAELKFQGGGMLDNIFFSNEAIPEPSLAALLLLGALALGFKPWVRS